MLKDSLIIENNEVYRNGLVKIISGMQKFGDCQELSVSEFMNNVKQKVKFDKYCLVIYGPTNKVEEFEFVIENIEKSQLIILAFQLKKSIIIKALESGVAGLFSKDIKLDHLTIAIEEIVSENYFSDIKMDSKFKDLLLHNIQEKVEFTEVEKEVLELVCCQMSSTEIAKTLCISPRTVESRKQNMMRKTNSKNMIGVVVFHFRSTYHL